MGSRDANQASMMVGSVTTVPCLERVWFRMQKHVLAYQCTTKQKGQFMSMCPIGSLPMYFHSYVATADGPSIVGTLAGSQGHGTSNLVINMHVEHLCGAAKLC